VILAVALAVAVLLVAGAGLAWTARLIHVGNLDALALAEKAGTPDPVSALDWPELQVKAVVPQPDEPSRILLLVSWPAHPEREATLLVALDGDDPRYAHTLGQWCATGASVSPARRGGETLELRRRRSLQRVHAILVAEDCVPARQAPGSRHSSPDGGPDAYWA
jgi:hypothetical protein